MCVSSCIWDSPSGSTLPVPSCSGVSGCISSGNTSCGSTSPSCSCCVFGLSASTCTGIPPARSAAVNAIHEIFFAICFIHFLLIESPELQTLQFFYLIPSQIHLQYTALTLLRKPLHKANIHPAPVSCK